MKYILVLILLPLTVIGTAQSNKGHSHLLLTSDLKKAPKPIALNESNYLVPIDIVENAVNWNISESTEIVKSVARVKFKVSKEGYPFLLLNPNTIAKDKNGNLLSIKPVKNLFGNYFYIESLFMPGETHEVLLQYSFKKSFKENKNFLPLNYSKHQYIEMGIPANAMYDRFKVNLKIYIENSDNYKIITNGEQSKIDINTYLINFPSYFTSISHFIDIVSKHQITSESIRLKSIDGRELQLFTYSTLDDSAKHLVPVFSKNVEHTFHDLEKKYGPYPFDKKIIVQCF